MKLKKSNYNIEVSKVNLDDVLIYNTLTHALVVLDKNTYEFYINIESKSDIEEPISNENIRTLYENGILIKEDLDEYLVLKNALNEKKHKHSLFFLAIAPTLDCNMACPYCFEHKSKKYMNENTKEQIKNFVLKQLSSGDYKFFYVLWTGGEPLMCTQVIKDLSESFIAISNERNIIYNSEIITNGSLLNYETAILLKEKFKINHAQITIDGLEKTNNKRRLLKNNEESFNLIINNIKECKGVIHITLRVNIDKENDKEFESLLDYIHTNIGFDENIDIYFSRVHTFECNINNRTCYSHNEFGIFEANLKRELYNKNKYSYLRKFDYKKPIFKCKILDFDSFVIDPEGLLYKCTCEIGNHLYNVGNVFDGPAMTDNMIKWNSIDTPDVCKTCSLFPICQGGCYYELIHNSGPNGCSYQMSVFKEDMKIYYEHLLNNKNNISV